MLRGRLWAEVVRKSLRFSCEEDHGLKLRGRLWAQVRRNAICLC